jgi:hypothetical protein
MTESRSFLYNQIISGRKKKKKREIDGKYYLFNENIDV